MLKAIVHVVICRCTSELKKVKSEKNNFFYFKSDYLCCINILFSIILSVKNICNV